MKSNLYEILRETEKKNQKNRGVEFPPEKKESKVTKWCGLNVNVICQMKMKIR